MTNTNKVSLTLQALFERLEVDTYEIEGGTIVPATAIAGLNGKFVPLYASDSHFYSFRGSNGCDYSYTTRECAQTFLDVYHQWFKDFQESLEGK